MPATARLIVMMTPEDKDELSSRARAAHVSVAELARRQLMGTADTDEREFMEAVVDLGKRASVIFRAADKREAEQRRAEADRSRHEAELRLRVERAFKSQITAQP